MCRERITDLAPLLPPAGEAERALAPFLNQLAHGDEVVLVDLQALRSLRAASGQGGRDPSHPSHGPTLHIISYQLLFPQLVEELAAKTSMTPMPPRVPIGMFETTL